MLENDALYLDKLFKNLNFDISVGMSDVRRVQKLSFKQLEKRFWGIQEKKFKRYMQQSYPSMRPLHIVAAYSWITMTPMTYFQYRLFYPDIHHEMLSALICSGKLPSCQFNAILDIILNLLDAFSKQELSRLIKSIRNEEDIDSYDLCFPPKELNIDEFARDYYGSVAITTREYREKNDIPIDVAARLLGVSNYQYKIVENVRKFSPLPVSIGFRAKLGFQLKSYANFTREMYQFPEFHRLRKIQHARNKIIVTALKYLDKEQQKLIGSIIKSLSSLYLD